MNLDSPQSTALLLVDLQRDFLRDDGRLPVAREQVSPLIDEVSTLVARARDAGMSVVHIANAFPRRSPFNIFRKFAAIEGSEGARFDERCPQPGFEEPVFEKVKSNAFSNPELAPWLHARGITRVVLCGVFANGCVRRTAEGALAVGFSVQVSRVGVAAGGTAAKERGLRAIERAGGRVAA